MTRNEVTGQSPKEKAEELVNKYFDWYGDPFYFSWDKAKQCALIAVEEIINNYEEKYKYCNTRKYWQEVKREIEQL